MPWKDLLREPRLATSVALVALASAVVAPVALAKPTPIEDRVVDLDAPRPDDTRQMRAITLDNGLQALLVSDPKFQRSAAALDVNVGSMEDPDDDPGLAHFLEHLLFLGTEKYPDVEEFDRYMSNNQGSNNAYTAPEHTNYQFELPHEAFEGGLDRFAQFFVAPVFNPEFVERERSAVNSEHQKNIQQDGWRLTMVQRLTLADGHPARRFSTGNHETLSDVDRDRVVEFYNKYYSANVMKLCMLSNASLDQLESWTREKFSAVPNRDRGRLEYSSDLFADDARPMFVQIKPVTDTRTLELEFLLPPLVDHQRAKPHRLISGLIGHEGEGSLLSELKRENLATRLGTGTWSSTFAGYLSISATLTEEGRANVDRVVELFFAYVEMLRESGLNDRFFTEVQTVTDLNYYFRDQQEGMWTAASFASDMHDFPALELERRQAIFYDFDPDEYAEFLGFLTPENLRVTLQAPDAETDTVERWYGAEYSISKFPEDTVARWESAKAGSELHIPEANPFVPNDLSLLMNDSHDEPYRLIDDERGIFWFQQDRKFKLPKGRVSLLMLSDAVNGAPRDRLLNTLYVRALNESLNEWLYPVLEAGLGVAVVDDARGVEIRFSGYSQRIPDLMVAVADRLDKIDITEEKFAAIKDDLRREYANFDYNQAYQQTFYEYAYLMNPIALHQRDYRDLVDEVTLDEVKDFAKNVCDRTAIEGVAYGNLDPEAIEESVAKVYERMAKTPLSAEARKHPRALKLPRGEEFARVFSTHADNNCWMKAVQFGERNYELEALLRIGAGYLESRFYTDLRTRQQLGYIVFSGANLQSAGQGMFFLIQSADYSAPELADRAETWIAENVSMLSEMEAEEFATIKAAVIAELEEEETNMTERLGTLSYECIVLEGDVGRKARVKAEVEKATPDAVAQAYAWAFASDRIASLALYLDAEGKPKSAPEVSVLDDLEAFKKQYPTF